MGPVWQSPYLHSVRKRSFDLVVCLLILPPALALMALVGLLVLACDGWPIMLFQTRVGERGRLFRMPKFRTMRLRPGGDEKSITGIGRVLRKHRLDELPQVFSVLLGHMSLVGPRPELVEIVADYSAHHRQRLAAKPGVTGIWQVRGSREVNIHESLGYDRLYLRKASLCLDLKILAMTIRFVIRPKPHQI